MSSAMILSLPAIVPKCHPSRPPPPPSLGPARGWDRCGRRMEAAPDGATPRCGPSPPGWDRHKRRPCRRRRPVTGPDAGRGRRGAPRRSHRPGLLRAQLRAVPGWRGEGATMSPRLGSAKTDNSMIITACTGPRDRQRRLDPRPRCAHLPGYAEGSAQDVPTGSLPNAAPKTCAGADGPPKGGSAGRASCEAPFPIPEETDQDKETKKRARREESYLG